MRRLPLRDVARLRYRLDMATASLVIERFAERTGLRPNTFEVLLRLTREAGYTPKGISGGRGKAAHFDATHLKNLVLACAGYQPSDGVAAIEALDGLIKSGSDLQVSLGDWLKAQIEHIATKEGEAEVRQLLLERGATQSPLPELAMCVSPPSAWYYDVVTQAEGAFTAQVSFRELKDDPSLSPPAHSLRRTTTITLNLLLTAGELLADTLERQRAKSAPDPFSNGSVREIHDPEGTKAAGPGSHDGLPLKQSALATNTPRTAPRKKAPSAQSDRSKKTGSGSASREMRGC